MIVLRGLSTALTALLAALFSAACAAAVDTLPAEVRAALKAAGVPPESMAATVLDAATGKRLLAWNEARPVNPASLMKLVTTQAALERLGPAWTWITPVWLSGTRTAAGVLEGSVFIKGSGDPKLVVERVWLLLRRLQQHGVREIRGDIVLDNSAFVVPEAGAGDFDGEPLRPYNVRPAALLFNQRAVIYSFFPDPAAGVARVVAEPTLLRTLVDRTVPLGSGACEDWRAALKASFEPGRTRFNGSFPAACGDLVWPVADPQPATYETRLLETLWREMGGVLHGSVREGPAPVDQKPTFDQRSPSLAEIVRDINKFSNNVMAQQLFLTLALNEQPRLPATVEAARDTLARWLAERSGTWSGDEVVIDNGSGLSRRTRISAQRLARVLLLAHDGPWMSELMSSLPVAGLDGTLRRSRNGGPAGSAHLKTGSLRDVVGVAGYVLSNSGRRYVVVVIVNHPLAQQARPALDTLLLWTLRK